MPLRHFLLPLLLAASCRTAEHKPAPPAVELLGVVEIPKTPFREMPVGGLSSLSLDADGTYLSLSDDRGEAAPMRFLTLKIAGTGVELLGVTPLLDGVGLPLAANSMDPEGMAPWRDAVIVSSEGITSRGVPPAISIYERSTGRWRRNLEVPAHFLPDAQVAEQQKRGVRENYGFEALAVTAVPETLYVGVEAPLAQDAPLLTRMLRYDLSADDIPLVEERAYRLEERAPGTIVHGITSLLALEDGSLLVLERSWGPSAGFFARLFRTSWSGADVRAVDALPADTPVMQKRLVVDLGKLGVPLDNLEGLAFGPAYGERRTLYVVSDDNFRNDQKTQILWLAISGL